MLINNTIKYQLMLISLFVVAAARGVVSAPPEPLSGLLVWNGRQHYAQLLPNAICWALQGTALKLAPALVEQVQTRLRSHVGLMVAGDVYQQLPYDEIVGVSRSRRKNGFILHSYPLKNPNQVTHPLLHLTPSPA